VFWRCGAAAAFAPTAVDSTLSGRSAPRTPKRVVLFGRTDDHCLADLLYRLRQRELECDITSGHLDHEDLRGLLGMAAAVRFRVFAPLGREAGAQECAFEEMEAMRRRTVSTGSCSHRYMQIPAGVVLCRGAEGRIINIHTRFSAVRRLGARPVPPCVRQRAFPS